MSQPHDSKRVSLKASSNGDEVGLQTWWPRKWTTYLWRTLLGAGMTFLGLNQYGVIPSGQKQPQAQPAATQPVSAAQSDPDCVDRVIAALEARGYTRRPGRYVRPAVKPPVELNGDARMKMPANRPIDRDGKQ